MPAGAGGQVGQARQQGAEQFPLPCRQGQALFGQGDEGGMGVQGLGVVDGGQGCEQAGITGLEGGDGVAWRQGKERLAQGGAERVGRQAGLAADGGSRRST